MKALAGNTAGECDFLAVRIPNSLAWTLGRREGQTTGIAAVKANPSQHGLYTQTDLNDAMEAFNDAGVAV
jgi:hypothetical protein